MKYKYLIITTLIIFGSIIYVSIPNYTDAETAKSSIKDHNFKLTVIDSLMESSILDFGEFDDFLKLIEGQQYDYEKEGYVLSKKAYDFFKDYPLSIENLSSIEELYLDGGLEIYSFIFPFWGGETDDFDIKSLKDLSHLPNLRVFDANSMLNAQ